jgi:hypothetical protein
MLWATGVGSVIRPMAAPVLGGLLIADEVIDVFLPVLYFAVRSGDGRGSTTWASGTVDRRGTTTAADPGLPHRAHQSLRTGRGELIQHGSLRVSPLPTAEWVDRLGGLVDEPIVRARAFTSNPLVRRINRSFATRSFEEIPHEYENQAGGVRTCRPEHILLSLGAARPMTGLTVCRRYPLLIVAGP